MYKIKEFSTKTGVSVRTLHYYDEIGLLKPASKTKSGYRIYSLENLATMQQILFFRELDFKLNEIMEIISNPNYDKIDALKKHLKLLTFKKNQLNEIINSVEEIISKKEWSENMRDIDKYENCNLVIEELKKKYKLEAKEKYGNFPAYKESQKKTSKYNKVDWNNIMTEEQELYHKFVETMHDYSSREAQSLVVEWKNYITKYFYNCTDEILCGLGEMYIADKRFTKNIDRLKPGLAKFISDAIKYYSIKG